MNNRVYKKILDNKLRLLLIPTDTTDIVSVGFFVKIGSRYEDKENNGISHFLEHMMFKCTKHFSSNAITAKLDSIGARYNAETSYESTNYYVYGHKNTTDTLIDIMVELYKNPVFREDDIMTERGVIAEEISMDDSDPQDIVIDLMFEHLFSNSSLKYPIIGTKKTITQIGREELSAFRKKYYCPPRTVFVVCGNFDREKVQKKCEHLLKSVKCGKDGTTKMPTVDEIVQTEPKLIVKQVKGQSQTNIVFAFRAQSLYSKNADHYELISDILGTGSSSRLFDLLRNQLGATYFTHAYYMGFMHEGAFVIHVGVEKKRVDEIIGAVLDELRKLRKRGVTENELEKAKQIRITTMNLGLQTPQDLMSYYGSNELLYNVPPCPTGVNVKYDPKTKIEAFNNITLKQINDVVKELFVKEKLNIFVYGNYPKSKKLSKSATK